MNRYNDKTNLVPAKVPRGAGRRVNKKQLVRNVADLALTEATVHVDAPMTTLEGTSERTTSMDRSRALVVRLAPFSVVWLVLSVGVSWAASMGAAFTLMLFAGLTACTYAYLDRQEYQFSRNGLERHKVNTLASLKRDEMAHQQELRRMALEAHLKMLGVDNDQDE